MRRNLRSETPPPAHGMRRAGTGRVAALLALCASAACATYDVRMAPVVQEAELRGAGTGVDARIVVAWRGVEARDERPELRFRVRVENPGTTTFTLVPADFELLDGALAPLGPPRVENLPVALEPGASATFDLAFPTASERAFEALDLAAVTLRTRFQDGRWTWSTTFQRAERVPYPYDPYWDSPWHVHVGVVWCRR